MSDIGKKIDIEKLEHFLIVSKYYYLTTFFIMTVFFILYLWANKNNRACQYGSTLYCPTETPYYLHGSNDSYIQIEFINTTKTIATKVNYPYSTTATYDIVYNFGVALPSTVKDYGSGTGVSFNTTYGASIYFPASTTYLASDTKNWSEFVLKNSGINLDLYIIDNDNNPNTIEYTYAFVSDDTLTKITPATGNFYTSKTITNNSLEPIKANWVNLLKKNKVQETGCATDVSKCACIDPSYISYVNCLDYVFVKSKGYYCPPNNLNCSLCTGSTDSTDCGHRFCSTNQITANDKSGYEKLDKGYYQTSNITGIRKPTTSDYTLGVGGELLTTALSAGSYENLPDYPPYQKHRICGGTGVKKNNFNDGTTVDPKFTTTTAGYNPQHSTKPRLDNGKNFDF